MRTTPCCDDISNDFIHISFATSGDLCFEKEIELTANQGFKIVKSHSWAGGGYGFNLFAGSTTFNPELYEYGENENIVVKESGTYPVKVRLGLNMFSANISENDFDPLMMDITKN